MSDNNDIYRTLRKDSEEEASVSETRLAVSMSRLLRNRDWKILVEDMLLKRLDGAREQADKLEGPELHRFQGEIRVLKVLINLQTAFIAQQNTIEHAQEENLDGF